MSMLFLTLYSTSSYSMAALVLDPKDSKCAKAKLQKVLFTPSSVSLLLLFFLHPSIHPSIALSLFLFVFCFLGFLETLLHLG